MKGLHRWLYWQKNRDYPRIVVSTTSKYLEQLIMNFHNIGLCEG